MANSLFLAQEASLKKRIQKLGAGQKNEFEICTRPKNEFENYAQTNFFLCSCQFEIGNIDILIQIFSQQSMPMCRNIMIQQGNIIPRNRQLNLAEISAFFCI